MSYEETFDKLRSNPPEVCEEAARILYKIADNIMQDPCNLKVRNLQKSNATIHNKVLSPSGGVDCLKLMGFHETATSFNLPEDACLENIELIRDALLNLTSKDIVELQSDKTKTPQKVAESTIDDLPRDIKRFVLPPLTLKYSNQFLSTIQRQFHAAIAFGDKDTQARAKELIPLDRLEAKAKQSLKNFEDRAKTENSSVKCSLQDMLLLELLAWFKEEFFTWVDSPDCSFCKSKTIMSHMSSDPKDLVYTNRVEVFKCTVCSSLTKFPRYNDLNILLHTRKGRCGEWAQVFTLMCCSLGWDSRYVVDELDHVWTEVYSLAQERWIHCDSCENACDTPLMYESGWNKKLTYVIAYSSEEVQDVTWRYTSNHKEVLGRRFNCKEDELITALIELRNERQKSLPEERKLYLSKRLIMELIELMIERKPNDNESNGRISGSAEWRKMRGEIKSVNNFTWDINDDDIVDNKLTIQYTAAQNIYQVVRGDGVKTKIINDWNAGVFSYLNIFRKEEKDWKTVYLARTEGTDSANITWKFQLKGNRVINQINLYFAHKTYENGQVDIKLCNDGTCIKIPQGTINYETRDFSGSQTLSISAHLSGGKGNIAWQHAQLFRQPLDSNEFPFILKLNFK